MRSHKVFEDFGHRLGPVKRPGYGQKQVADDLIFAGGLLPANWRSGWLKNRGGFAFSPHFPHPHELIPTVRSWMIRKTAASVKYAG